MIQSLFHYLGISTLLFDDLSQLWRMIIYVFSSPISNKNMKKDNYTCTSVMKRVRIYFIILASLSNFSKVNCMWSKNFMKKAVSPVKSLRNMSQHYELWHETRFQMIL